MKRIASIIAITTVALVSCNKGNNKGNIESQEAADDEVPAWLKKGPVSEKTKAVNKAKEDALLRTCAERDGLYAGYVKILEANVGNPGAAVIQMKTYVRVTAPKIEKLNDEIHAKGMDLDPDVMGRCMRNAAKVSTTAGDRFRAVIEKMGDQDEPLRNLKRRIDDALHRVRLKR